MNPPDLAGRRLFITGGTGFVGRTLLDHLIGLRDEAGQDFAVTVLSRDPGKFLAAHPRYAGRPWLGFLPGSLDAFPAVEGEFSDMIHAAADTHLQGGGAAWIDQIVNGTRRALEFALRIGARRFLHTSSGAVYGAQPPELERLTEDYGGAPPTTLPGSTYGQAKRVAEQLCTIFWREHGLETVNARCFAIAGEHLPLDGPYALGNFIRDALSAEFIRVRGDGTAVRTYIDGEDMARAICGLLLAGVPGEAYNLGADEPVTTGELARRIGTLIAPQKRVVIENAEAAQPQLRSRYIPSIRKLRDLGLGPRHGLDAVLRRTAAHFAGARGAA